MCRSPIVSLSSPANGATYTFPGSFPVTATVNNLGQPHHPGELLRQQYLFQTVTTAPYSVPTRHHSGTYTFRQPPPKLITARGPGFQPVSVTVNPPIPKLQVEWAQRPIRRISTELVDIARTRPASDRKEDWRRGAYGQITTTAANATS